MIRFSVNDEQIEALIDGLDNAHPELKFSHSWREFSSEKDLYNNALLFHVWTDLTAHGVTTSVHVGVRLSMANKATLVVISDLGESPWQD